MFEKFKIVKYAVFQKYLKNMQNKTSIFLISNM